MPIWGWVLILFIGIPMFAGWVSGMSSTAQPTYFQTTWAYKDVPEQNVPVFDHGQVTSDQNDLTNVLPLFETEEPENKVMEYENSIPSMEMNQAIDELFAKLEAEPSQEPSVNSDVAAFLGQTEGTEEREPLAQDEHFNFYGNKSYDSIVEVDRGTDHDFIPSPLPPPEYLLIEKKYGSYIASQITTTPGYGRTGEKDIMIGRLAKTVVGDVLTYGNYAIPITGNYPVVQEGKVVLIQGQFVSPEEFYVLETYEPDEVTTTDMGFCGDALVASY